MGDVARCRAWLEGRRRQRCEGLERRVRSCRQAACPWRSEARCRLRVLHCRYIKHLQAVSCKSQTSPQRRHRYRKHGRRGGREGGEEDNQGEEDEDGDARNADKDGYREAVRSSDTKNGKEEKEVFSAAGFVTSCFVE